MQYLGAVSDAQAIIAALESCGKTLDVAPLKKTVAAYGGQTKAKSRHRKNCAIKTLIAVWSWERVSHYHHFTSLGVKALESLVKVANHYPQWEDFAQIANCCMIERHEQSVWNGKRHAIGYMPKTGLRLSTAPLEKCDIDCIAAGLRPKLALAVRLLDCQWLAGQR